MNKPALNSVPAWIEGSLHLKVAIEKKKLREHNKQAKLKRRLRGKQTVAESMTDAKALNKLIRTAKKEATERLQPKELRSLPYGYSILDCRSPRNH
jgi:hypothetical protein